MVFNTERADGTVERRQHIPYRLERQGDSVLAFHAVKGHKLGRFESEEIATRHCNTMSEPYEG